VLGRRTGVDESLYLSSYLNYLDDAKICEKSREAST
jgi:hypothetical protein